jgi:hypothetical protein
MFVNTNGEGPVDTPLEDENVRVRDAFRLVTRPLMPNFSSFTASNFLSYDTPSDRPCSIFKEGRTNVLDWH